MHVSRSTGESKYGTKRGDIVLTTDGYDLVDSPRWYSLKRLENITGRLFEVAGQWERTFRTPFSYPNLGAPPVNRSRLREELALDLAGLLETVPIAVQYVLMLRFGSHK